MTHFTIVIPAQDGNLNLGKGSSSVAIDFLCCCAKIVGNWAFQNLIEQSQNKGSRLNKKKSGGKTLYHCVSGFLTINYETICG